MVELTSRTGELIDIRGEGRKSGGGIGGDDRRQRRIGFDYLGSENRAGNEAGKRLAVIWRNPS